MSAIALAFLFLMAEAPANSSRPVQQAPAITDAMRARYWQAVSENTAAQSNLQMVIGEMRDTCGKTGLQLTQDPQRQPTCAAAPEAPKPEVKK